MTDLPAPVAPLPPAPPAPDADAAHAQAGRLAARGESYRLAKQHAEALRCFTEALALRPDYAWAHAHLGATYQVLGDLNQATLALKRAIHHHPTYAWAYANLGESYRLAVNEKLLGDPLILLSGSDHPIQESVASLRQTWEWAEESVSHLKRAVELDPGYFWAHAHLGAAYRLQALYLELHGAALAELPSDKPRRRSLYEEALHHLEQAVQQNPAYGWALAYRGGVRKFLSALTKDKEAKRRYLNGSVKDIARAIALEPSIAHDLHYQVGILCAHKGKYKHALVQFEKGLAEQPHNPTLLVARAITLHRYKGDGPESRLAMQQAEKLLVGQLYANLTHLTALSALAPDASALSSAPDAPSFAARTVALLQTMNPHAPAPPVGLTLPAPTPPDTAQDTPPSAP